jgi:hypothetical protein
MCMFATAWVADKYRIRGPIIMGNSVVTIIGLAMMGWAPGIPAQYAGVFFTCAGANSNIPHMMSWQANNIRGQWKRAFCSATLVAFGGIGGIAGSLVFRFVNHVGILIYVCVREPHADELFEQRRRQAGLQAGSMGLHDWQLDNPRDYQYHRHLLLFLQQEASSGRAYH